MIKASRLIAFALALAVAGPAAAWNNQGHMATGAIAYDALKARDPAVIAAIEALMAQHPDRARFERSLAGLTGAARQRRLFELMARWPDDIRETPYDHPDWHYAARVVSGWPLFSAYTAGEAETQFAANLAIAGDRRASAAARATALGWIFHIVGDMHEPLHAGHRQSWTFPLTDRLGTIAFVRSARQAEPITLHEYWDGAVDFAGDEAQAAGKVSAEIERLYPIPASVTLAGTPAANFGNWVAESRSLSADVVYQGAALQASKAADDAPRLTPAYEAQARQLSLRRVGDGGYHLAGVLKAIFDPSH